MKAWVNTGCYWLFFFLLGFWSSGFLHRARLERAYEERFVKAIRNGIANGLLQLGPEAVNFESTDQEVTPSAGPIPFATLAPEIGNSAAAIEKSRQRMQRRKDATP